MVSWVLHPLDLLEQRFREIERLGKPTAIDALVLEQQVLVERWDAGQVDAFNRVLDKEGVRRFAEKRLVD